MNAYEPKFAYNRCTQIYGQHIPQNSIYMKLFNGENAVYIWTDMQTVLSKDSYKVKRLFVSDIYPKTLYIHHGSRIQKLLHRFAIAKLNEFNGEIRKVEIQTYELNGLKPNNRLTADYKNFIKYKR